MAAQLTWDRHLAGGGWRSIGPVSGTEYYAELVDGQWRLFDDDQHVGAFEKLSLAMAKAEAIEAELEAEFKRVGVQS
jgi:hypothetical protein